VCLSSAVWTPDLSQPSPRWLLFWAAIRIALRIGEFPVGQEEEAEMWERLDAWFHGVDVVVDDDRRDVWKLVSDVISDDPFMAMRQLASFLDYSSDWVDMIASKLSEIERKLDSMDVSFSEEIRILDHAIEGIDEVKRRLKELHDAVSAVVDERG